MTFWVAGAVVVGSAISADAAGRAAGSQADAASRAADLQYKQWQEQKALMEPWRAAGEKALNQLTPLALDYQPFTMDKFSADPGYAFRLAEGQKSLERSAAARGGLISGNALRAATRYGQEMGSQEYTNAFNRYQTERAARLQPLQSLAGVGLSTAQTIGNAGAQAATQIGEQYAGAANARASGYVGTANAINSGIGTYLNYNQGQNYLSALRQPGGVTGYKTPTWGAPVDATQVLA